MNGHNLNKLALVVKEPISKDELFTLITQVTLEENIHRSAVEIKKLLELREELGSTIIDEYVSMPHVESANIEKSTIVIVKCNSPITDWDDNLEPIKIIAFIFLNENEDKAVLSKVKELVIKLIDSSEQLKLLEAADESEFEKVVMGL